MKTPSLTMRVIALSLVIKFILITTMLIDISITYLVHGTLNVLWSASLIVTIPYCIYMFSQLDRMQLFLINKLFRSNHD